jgi:hypothetical protein
LAPLVCRLLFGALGLVAGLGLAPALADTKALANYVINLGGTIVAEAAFTLNDTGSAYTLSLDANVSGIAQLVASGTVKVTSTGTSSAHGLQSQDFDFLTRSGGEDFTVSVNYAGGTVSAFKVTPPIVNNIDRVPVERKQLSHVNDMLAAFVLKGTKLDRSLCDNHAQIFTGIERFDLDYQYAKQDVATSPRTGYQGPVVLCHLQYKPISGHYTTSALTNGLAQDDRILIWYAPLKDTGFFIPYRVLLTTSMGDLSMVLTTLAD